MTTSMRPIKFEIRPLPESFSLVERSAPSRLSNVLDSQTRIEQVSIDGKNYPLPRFFMTEKLA